MWRTSRRTSQSICMILMRFSANYSVIWLSLSLSNRFIFFPAAVSCLFYLQWVVFSISPSIWLAVSPSFWLAVRPLHLFFFSLAVNSPQLQHTLSNLLEIRVEVEYKSVPTDSHSNLCYLIWVDRIQFQIPKAIHQVKVNQINCKFAHFHLVTWNSSLSLIWADLMIFDAIESVMIATVMKVGNVLRWMSSK